MIARKFSQCFVGVKNQICRSYISSLYCSVLWLYYSTTTFDMIKVAYNNVYRALMWIAREYGHSIFGEICTNNIGRFEDVFRKNNFQFERLLTQKCKHCCCFLCIFTVSVVIESLMC